MQKIDARIAHWLHDIAATRRIEAAAAAALPSHNLMQRAGLASARLALAIAPHARSIWIACGPGNNGGDGLEAAMHLQHWGKNPVVSWLGSPEQAPPDALASYRRAHEAGVRFADAPPQDFDLCLDALLGIGATRAPQDKMARWIEHINTSPAPVLAIDAPSGLHADTGATQGLCVKAQHTLSLLTLKPGLFTAMGRDMAGQVWFDDLATHSADRGSNARAVLAGAPPLTQRAHASHKGSHGDVAVIGGAPGMTGAALLAARAALHGGAGRVYVGLLDGASLSVDVTQPELMFRPPDALDLTTMSVVCGCGGGDAVRGVLARILSTARHLVLDADALNTLSTDTQLQTLLRARHQRARATVLTPHPLEAARLLGSTAQQVQQDRLAAAEELARRFACTVVLKGSGTVTAAPGQTSVINPTGNARLATAGTGDVLAGLIGARLAAGASAFEAAWQAAYRHGWVADRWPEEQTLTAGALTRSC
jgi:hydroxyethylthiazole kinase-like uncharacterized protein yjeF